jgi:copper resistance protein D
MQALANMLNTLLEDLLLITYAYTMGGLVWSLLLLSNDEILLHRLGALIACVVGLIEWQARVRCKPASRLPYVIPVLCAVGGLLLLGHAHEGLQPKEEFLVQITHNVIGLLAVIMACGRWLELRLTPPAGCLAGVVSLSALLVIGLVLLFYRETAV